MNEEPNNGEFAKKLNESVEAFAALDGACDKVRSKGICDAVGVKCDLSCKIFVKKDKLLKLIEESVKAEPATVATVGPEAPAPTAPTKDQTAEIEEIPVKQYSEDLCVPLEKPKEKHCPSCGMKPARAESKYCDYCGEELS